MSDPPKSASFSFNPQATSGSTTTNFGQPSSSTSTTTGTLFGQNSGTSASSNSSPFPIIPTSSGTSPFGGFGTGVTTGGGLFRGGDKSSSGGFSFAPNPASNTLSKSLETNKTGSATSSNNVPSLGFTTLSTPNKLSEATVPGQTQTTNIFGGVKGTGDSGLFVGASTIAGSSAETSTPTSKPSTNYSFGTSTTPAGPPPTDSTGTGTNSSSMFNLNKSQEPKSSIFASANTTQSIVPPANTFSGFGASVRDSGSIFGSKLAEPVTTGSAPHQGHTSHLKSTENFNSTTSSFFTKSATETTTGIFGKAGGKPKDGESDGIGNITATTNPAAPLSRLGSKLLAGVQSAQTSNSPQAPSTASNAFSTPGAKSDAPGTAPKGGGIFSNLNKSAPNTTSSTNEPAVTIGTSGQSTSSAPAPTFAPTSSLIGGAASLKTASTLPQPTAPAAATSTSGGINATLGTSTAGPPPPAQSRLKNKSMDEIITRWASDLSKYQKDFQRQAERVASWDRMLVENSDKIQKLYGSTLEAERATTEVERQLTAVENDQAELAVWLEHYEKEVNQMMSNTVSPGDSQGPDQERERAYKLANKLSERLEEMGKDLTGMITEINDASSKLSKNSKADDPLSQVVRVLNNHLAQLQQIDQGAAALQAKVAAAQKAGQSLGPSNGLVGPSSDAADGFYRSYMGRR